MDHNHCSIVLGRIAPTEVGHSASDNNADHAAYVPPVRSHQDCLAAHAPVAGEGHCKS